MVLFSEIHHMYRRFNTLSFLFGNSVIEQKEDLILLLYIYAWLNSSN